MEAIKTTILNRPFQGIIPKKKIHAIWGSRPPAAIAKGGIVLTIKRLRLGDYRVTIRPTAATRIGPANRVEIAKQ